MPHVPSLAQLLPIDWERMVAVTVKTENLPMEPMYVVFTDTLEEPTMQTVCTARKVAFNAVVMAIRHHHCHGQIAYVIICVV